jgi:hypothetical protein
MSFHPAGRKLRDFSNTFGPIGIFSCFEQIADILSKQIFEKSDGHGAADALFASLLELAGLRRSNVDADKLPEILEELSKFA